MELTKENKRIIPHLGILVTTYCNLNCRNCADLIPKRKKYNYNIQDIINDMNKILASVSAIQEVLIIGGETLLYPQLKEVVEFCGAEKKIGKIIITSNGTLLPASEVMGCLKKNKVCIRVSGYPEHVAPKRKSILETYRLNGLEIDDLENMQWADMGSFEKRNHTEMELNKIFKSCSMAYCVTLQKDGLIFYCSRSLSAYETNLYPKPIKREFIDVRNEENLIESFERFYNIPYLTTCDYCDGISCVTSKFVPAAIQILDKKVFLDLLSVVCEFQEKSLFLETTIEKVKHILLDNSEFLCDKQEYLECLYALEKLLHIYNKENNYNFGGTLIKLVNCITDDYNFVVSDGLEFAKKCQRTCANNYNQITVGGLDGSLEEDVLFDDKEVLEEFQKRYSLDYADYNRLFVETELSQLKTKKIQCAVCGLSYTQYGIIKEKMPIKTVNLSVTGQDIPYSLIMAKKAIEIQPEIKIIVIPFTYYQGFYDMSADDAFIHRDIIKKVNLPILGEKRNYSEISENEIDRKQSNFLKIYDKIFDFPMLQKERESEIKNRLVGKEYFNELFPEPCFGGLNFDFRALDEKERWESAKKTAKLNERVITKNGYEEVIKYLSKLLPELTKKGRKVVFFAPPMTKYLYAAYSDTLKKEFENQIIPFMKKYRNVEFIDFSANKIFEDDDFCDFEHLNYKGGVKLTSLLEDLLV